MPGPIFKLGARSDSSVDLSVFESCEDVQEAWGGSGLNGNFSSESVYQDCNKHFPTEYQINGRRAQGGTASRVGEGGGVGEDRENADMESGLPRVDVEGMDVEDVEEAADMMDMPVVEASLSVDISNSLTRHKILSVQRGRTLSYADKDDAEEFPTRRPRFLSDNEGTEAGISLQHPVFLKKDQNTPEKTQKHQGTSQEPKEMSQVPQSHSTPGTPQQHATEQQGNRITNTGTNRAIRVVRNPSYHFAVRESAVLSPNIQTKNSDTQTRSRDSSPARVTIMPMESVCEDEGELNSNRPNSLVLEGSAEKRHASDGDELMTLSLAPNMSRSVSFSGPESLSPTVPGRGSLSEGNSRSGSASQLSSSSSQTDIQATEITKPASSKFIRGSAISRSFRRFFSTPAGRSTTTPTSEIWLDIPDINLEGDASTNKASRLRKISTNLSRRISNRSSKMTTSQSAPGTNGLLLNGTSSLEDSRRLVEYEDLLKLFCCSGCQGFMAPPLHQCRKGHLVCNTCRYSLKQVCPMCKQRFADNTNMMMEQVCQLVKFPCKYAAEGCPEFHQPKGKLDHEHFCVYRPVHCHHEPKGCTKVLLLRDMHEHLEQCQFKAK